MHDNVTRRIWQTDSAVGPQPRRQLQQYAQLCERVLACHDDHKGPHGWCGADVAKLMGLLQKQMNEVEQAATDLMGSTANGFVHEVNVAKLATELGDLGNVAMMIADVTGALRCGGDIGEREDVK